MNQDASRTGGDPADDELVAYLDGELDGECCDRIERRLSEDADYRVRLQQLQRTWDLLDYLPRSTVDETFTRSTVEMVAVAAADDVKRIQAEISRKRPLRRALAGGTIAAAALAGYFLVWELASRPNEKLLTDLPIIENLEYYRHAESVDFLRALDKQGLFAEEAEDAM